MDYVEEGFAPDGIDTPSDDFYNINTTNFNRNHQDKSLIPRTPKDKPKPKVTSNKTRYNGPVNLLKHIYDMISEVVRKELDKYNKERKAHYHPKNNKMCMQVGVFWMAGASNAMNSGVSIFLSFVVAGCIVGAWRCIFGAFSCLRGWLC